MKSRLGYVMIICAGALWGTIGLFAAGLTGMGLTTTTRAFARLFFAAVLLIPIMLVARGPKAFKISRRHLLFCVLLGVITQGIFNFAYLSSIEELGAATAVVLLYTSPLYVAVLSMILFSERITQRKALAIGINLVGCFLTVTGGIFDFSSLSLYGILMGLLAGFTYALQPIFGKLAGDDIDPFTQAFYTFLFAAISLFVVSHPAHEIAAHFSLKLLGLMLAMAFVTSSLAQSLYFAGLKRITEPSRAPVMASVENVSASICGYLLLGEEVRIMKIIGIVIVIFSIFIMNGKSRNDHENSI